MRIYLFLTLLLVALVGCGGQAGKPEAAQSNPVRPSQVVAAGIEASPVAPQADFFYSLPNYSVGETITLDGYTITVAEATLDGSQLQLDLELANESGRPIDLAWAVQLIREESGYVAPVASPVDQSNVGEVSLANSAELGGVWSYDLQTEGLGPETPVDLDDYRLVYAPFGWSGPVFVFRLTPSAG